MMNRIRGWVWALGYRPRPGSIFYSPSRHMMDVWRPYASCWMTSFEQTLKEISMTEIKPDPDKVVVHDTKIGDLIGVEEFIFRVKGLTLELNKPPRAEITSIAEEIADGTFPTDKHLEHAEPRNRAYLIDQNGQNCSDDKFIMLIVGSCDEYSWAYENGWHRNQILHWCKNNFGSPQGPEQFVGNNDFTTYAKVYCTYKAVEYIDFDEMVKDAEKHGFEFQIIPLGPPRA